MKMMLRGPRIVLRPATETDRRSVYEWLACSDITASMIGPPHYLDHPVPTWEEFCADYDAHYFNDSALSRGRCFIIMLEGEVERMEVVGMTRGIHGEPVGRGGEGGAARREEGVRESERRRGR